MTDWQKINLFQPTDEHKMLRDTVRSFAREKLAPGALERDRKEFFDLKLFRSMGELGLLGITVSDQYGGSGLDALAAVIAHEEIAYIDSGFCLSYLAHSMLCANNIAVNGNETQKKKYLPKLSTGEWIGAMAMSEPNVGTDVVGMETRAVKVGNQYRINGRKMWITNGTIDDSGTPCDLVLVYARTDAEGEKKKISTFLVERGFAGFSVGQKIKDKTGMRASPTAELVFDNCMVPAENLVGAEGESLKHMMRNLEMERLTLAAISSGIAKRCIEVMNRYAHERHAFGSPLAHFGQIQRHIADSFAEYRALRIYLYDVARRMDLHAASSSRLDSDGVKLFASTAAKNIADRAMQVLGGYGYVGEYVVERLWRDAKLIEIGGGTLEAHQKNITRDLSHLVQNQDL